MQLNSIIIRPIITEKSAVHKDEYNRYHFKVNRRASKKAVAEAVEDVFSVDVVDVRTMIMPGKKRRLGKTRKFIKTPKWKKAIVTVGDGQEIKYD